MNKTATVLRDVMLTFNADAASLKAREFRDANQVECVGIGVVIVNDCYAGSHTLTLP